jgi:hypothetical protein
MAGLLLRLLLLELPLLELWAIAPILLLLWSTQVTPRWGIHHGYLEGPPLELSLLANLGIILPLFSISLSKGLNHPLLVNGCTRQLIVRQAGEPYQALLQMDGEPYTVQVGLLSICVDVL